MHETRDDIVLIGPPNVGKTTVARQLASRLDREHHELDRLRRDFFEEIGFDMDVNLALFEKQGRDVMTQYWGVFAPHAIERFFETHTGVLDLGGGSPVAWFPPLMERIERAFAPFEHVVLLLPDPDLETSVKILGAREETPESLETSQRRLIGHGGLQKLATHTVYTAELDATTVTERVLNAIDA